MDKMLSYVYTNIWKAENATRLANDMLKKQVDRNRRMKSVLVISILYAMFSELRNLNQKERIKELNRKIEELRRSEGG